MQCVICFYEHRTQHDKRCSPSPSLCPYITYLINHENIIWPDVNLSRRELLVWRDAVVSVNIKVLLYFLYLVSSIHFACALLNELINIQNHMWINNGLGVKLRCIERSK